MKFTLAFGIYNKADWIESLLRSWLDHLSGRHDVQIVLVFDACTDGSDAIARDVLSGYKWPCVWLYADDVYEIRCNNMALEAAAGDVIVFIQDDNWMHDRGYDDILAQAMTWERVGAVGLLAGLQLRPGLTWRRIEVDRPHKGVQFHGDGDQALGVYAVDAINRPFAIHTKTLRALGGLDEAYCPTSYDDLDLSIRLLQEGYTNLYVPFDVLNTCASKQTMGQAAIAGHYGRGRSLCRQRHQAYTDELESTLQMLYPLRESKDGLII